MFEKLYARVHWVDYQKKQQEEQVHKHTTQRWRKKLFQPQQTKSNSNSWNCLPTITSLSCCIRLFYWKFCYEYVFKRTWLSCSYNNVETDDHRVRYSVSKVHWSVIQRKERRQNKATWKGNKTATVKQRKTAENNNENSDLIEWRAAGNDDDEAAEGGLWSGS